MIRRLCIALLLAASFATAEELPAGPAGKFVAVDSLADVERQLEIASGKPVLLQIWARWSIGSLELDQTTFADASVQEALASVVVLRADISEHTDDHKALLLQFDIYGAPQMLFFNTEGGRIEDSDLTGYVTAERLLDHIREVFSL